MHALLVAAAVVAAEPTPEQRELLKVFRQEFVDITPGKDPYPASFLMGRQTGGSDAERPAHRVNFAYPFSVARYEVPQNLWEAVMGSNPSRWKGPRNSVENMSFAEAEQFCARATQLMRAAGLIRPRQVIRLPSEAEWEYVARAGTQSTYSFGDAREALGDYAWFTGNAAGNDPPVGAKKPNPWGLYDIHGYLWEWCRDTAHDNYQGAPDDGSAWSRGGRPQWRIVRGGSWKDKAEMLSSSYRRSVPAQYRDDAVGLRCVLSAEVSPERESPE